MKIDLSCPVELWHFKLPDTQEESVSLQLFNLIEVEITGLLASFTCFDKSGKTISKQVERIQHFTGSPRSAFEVQVYIEDAYIASGIDFSIERVWLKGGESWHKKNSNMVSYVPNTIEDPRLLKELRLHAGEDALGFPSDQGSVWLCVCGRVNSAEALPRALLKG